MPYLFARLITTLGNVVYLDTGGCFKGGRLTLFELGGAGEIISVPNISATSEQLDI